MKMFRSMWSMVTVVTIGCLAIVAIKYIERIPPARLASLMGITVTVSDLDPTPSPSPRVTPAGGDQAATLGSVAVQTFAGATLIRQGPGTAVSADGLVLTTVSAAPWGAGGYVYQIATPRGQLQRAKWVAWDKASGLVLLKTDATDFDAVLFNAEATLFAGQSMEAVAAQVLFSKFVSQRLPVWVAWVAEDGGATLSVDRSLGLTFNGARLVDDSNRSVGLLRYTSGPALITSATINTFLESYFASSEGN